MLSRMGCPLPCGLHEVQFTRSGDCDHLGKPHVGGTLVFPLAAPKPGGEFRTGLGAVLMIARTAEGYAARHLSPCGFVMADGPLAGSAEMRAKLWAAFGRGGVERVASLRRGAGPSDRDWFWAPTWSLSYDTPSDAV